MDAIPMRIGAAPMKINIHTSNEDRHDSMRIGNNKSSSAIRQRMNTIIFSCPTQPLQDAFYCAAD